MLEHGTTRLKPANTNVFLVVASLHSREICVSGFTSLCDQ